MSTGARFRITQQLAFEHGALLDASATAKALGFRSMDALRQARRDGRLPIPMFQIPGRRGWFASTQAVIEWLDAQVEAHVSEREFRGGRP